MRNPFSKRPNRSEESSNDDLNERIDKSIEKMQDNLDDIADPTGQQKRTRVAVERHNAGVSPTKIPSKLSPAEQAAEDAETEKARQEVIANSQERAQQQGESDVDYQHRIARLRERELRQTMTGGEVLERNQLLTQMAHDDFLRKTPYPIAEIVSINNGNLTLKLQKHPLWPRKAMSGDSIIVKLAMQPYIDDDNQPRFRHIQPAVGMTGTLRSQSDGLNVTWFFSKSA